MERETETYVVWKEREITITTYQDSGYRQNGVPFYIRKHIRTKDKIPYCSSCGKRTDGRFMHYCPNCGAIFKEKVNKHDN